MTQDQETPRAGTFAAICRDDKGSTAVEYALVTALMAAAVITAISTFAPSVIVTFESINNALGDQPDSPPALSHVQGVRLP